MIGAAIRTLRQALRWTQKRLANEVGCHQTSVSRWERLLGEPTGARRSRLESLLRSHAQLSQREEQRRAILQRLNGRHVVLSVSGGKDSAATSLFLSELGIEHERVFLDTGWESDVTYEYLRGELASHIGSIKWLAAPRQMEELILHKGMFPSKRSRWCTQELKVFPMARYLRGLLDDGIDVVNAVGIRAAESEARSLLPEWEWQDAFDCEVWRPLLRWTLEQVIEIHRRHGLRPNPLYLLGAHRVGCWPCIYARKSEIRLIAERDPARIVRLKVLEERVEGLAQLRAERAGRELTNPPAWFQNPSPTGHRAGPDGRYDGSCWPIERVVDWSRSAPRGRAVDADEFLLGVERDGCMRWGLCETGSPSTELVHA